MTENDTTTSFGKSFIWVAWFIGYCLLVFVFQDLLDEQYNPNQDPKLCIAKQW